MDLLFEPVENLGLYRISWASEHLRKVFKKLFHLCFISRDTVGKSILSRINIHTGLRERSGSFEITQRITLIYLKLVLFSKQEDMVKPLINVPHII